MLAKSRLTRKYDHQWWPPFERTEYNTWEEPNPVITDLRGRIHDLSQAALSHATTEKGKTIRRQKPTEQYGTLLGWHIHCANLPPAGSDAFQNGRNVLAITIDDTSWWLTEARIDRGDYAKRKFAVARFLVRNMTDFYAIAQEGQILAKVPETVAAQTFGMEMYFHEAGARIMNCTTTYLPAEERSLTPVEDLPEALVTLTQNTANLLAFHAQQVEHLPKAG